MSISIHNQSSSSTIHQTTSHQNRHHINARILKHLPSGAELGIDRDRDRDRDRDCDSDCDSDCDINVCNDGRDRDR